MRRQISFKKSPDLSFFAIDVPIPFPTRIFIHPIKVLRTALRIAAKSPQARQKAGRGLVADSLTLVVTPSTLLS